MTIILARLRERDPRKSWLMRDYTSAASGTTYRAGANDTDLHALSLIGADVISKVIVILRVNARSRASLRIIFIIQSVGNGVQSAQVPQVLVPASLPSASQRGHAWVTAEHALNSPT